MDFSTGHYRTGNRDETGGEISEATGRENSPSQQQWDLRAKISRTIATVTEHILSQEYTEPSDHAQQAESALPGGATTLTVE